MRLAVAAFALVGLHVWIVILCVAAALVSLCIRKLLLYDLRLPGIGGCVECLCGGR